ncbi:CHAT domain-containing protein [Kibdelosporangium phytohabitans]|uniref:CHAT domain-containing protein n=1 Tax=Kibdelosporangium phytohabitans TaxID=860235 RepID=UPI0019E245CD|nr:CHAT domain-containing protein [Kibdelosporangium phytohabitans]MBE1471823.1 tetratricopeptide (TPR) repeat protein [Kibdelosporangium phytohabitans]
MSDPTTAIETARELYSQSAAAGCSAREQEGRELAKQGLSVLDSVAPVGQAHHLDWLRIRIRLAGLLAALIADTDGIEVSLARLEALREHIQDVPDPVVRLELDASVDHNCGFLLLSAGRNEEGLVKFSSSIDRKLQCLADTDSPALVTEKLVHSLLARVLVGTRLGQIGAARADLDWAFRLAAERDLPVKAADCRHALANLELRTGNVPAALRHYEASSSAYQALGQDTLPLLRLDQAQALLTAGLAHEASTHLDEVLPIMSADGNSRELGRAERYRAQAALLTGDLDLALEMALRSEERMKRWDCQTCVADAALVALRVDTIRALRSDSATDLPDRALAFADSLPRPSLVEQAGWARMLATRVAVKQGDLGKAAELLDQVAPPSDLTTIDYRLLRRLCRAELADARGETGVALDEIRTGLAELDEVRDRMDGLDLVSGAALHGQELGELAVRLVLRGEDARKLFGWLERTRAQTYRYEPLGRVDDPQLAERIDEVRSLTQSLRQAQHDAHPTATIAVRRAQRLREAGRLGWHTGRWGQPRPVVGAPEVADALGSRALVSFVVSDDALVAVVLTDGDVHRVNLGPASEAAQRARMLNVDLNALAPDHLPVPMVQVVTGSARKQADRLDGLIGQPLRHLIGDRDLVVVPTGALYGVPWGLLPSMHGRPVVVAPSATAWLAAERATASRHGHTILVRSLGLPAAVGEIHKLSTHHETARLISGDEATVSAVLGALDGARLAHIAAHGAHEPENALFSRLELADGALFAHEIAGLNQPPRQVVLAACELALNRIRPGDEPLGFASALLASGSQTVIAPLSKVGDHASAAAMDDYHRRLAAGAEPAVALADAIAVDPFRRPFVCLGSSA